MRLPLENVKLRARDALPQSLRLDYVVAAIDIGHADQYQSRTSHVAEAVGRISG